MSVVGVCMLINSNKLCSVTKVKMIASFPAPSPSPFSHSLLSKVKVFDQKAKENCMEKVNGKWKTASQPSRAQRCAATRHLFMALKFYFNVIETLIYSRHCATVATATATATVAALATANAPARFIRISF